MADGGWQMPDGGWQMPRRKGPPTFPGCQKVGGPQRRLHASESGGRSRPEAVRGMPDVPIAPPSHRAPGGVGGCRLCQPSLFQQGVVGAFA